jgi:hypothetical protein
MVAPKTAAEGDIGISIGSLVMFELLASTNDSMLNLLKLKKPYPATEL